MCNDKGVISLTDMFRYTQNGILHMLDRNRRIKANPERFQSSKLKFDLIITCEERVYDQVLEGEDWRRLFGETESFNKFFLMGRLKQIKKRKLFSNT